MRRETVHRLFDASLLIKGVDGVLEITGGLLFILSPGTVTGVVAVLTAHELSRKPDNWIAHSAERWLNNFTSNTQHFVSTYLIVHGLIKLLLVLGLWREQRWAFPASLVFLGIFVVYQFYRVAHTHSLTLLTLAILDIAVMVLIYREYQFRKLDI